MLIRWSALGLVIALVGSAASAAPAARPESATRGFALAQRNCSGCHAIGARGASPNAQAPTFESLRTRYPEQALDAAFRRGLLHRNPSMTPFHFLPGELSDLAAYFHSLRGGATAPAERTE